jgi:hypothetical protein
MAKLFHRLFNQRNTNQTPSKAATTITRLNQKMKQALKRQYTYTSASPSALDEAQ